MPQVPNYKPIKIPERNEAELERLRASKAAREKEKREHKAQLKREEYWLNNPPYFKL